MTIDHNLITPLLCLDDPLLSCDIVGSGNNYCFRVNQDTLVSSNTKEYILAYRRELFETRGISVPSDTELSWRKDQAPLWSLDDLTNKSTNLMAWWKFDELNLTLSDGDSITTVSDSGPNGLTLTAVNTIAWDADGLNNKGTAVLTGADDHFTSPDVSAMDFDTNDISFYMVWKPALGTASHTQFWFLYKKEDGANFPIWDWNRKHTSGRGGTTRKMRFARRVGSANTVVEGDDGAISDGTGYIHSVNGSLSDDTIDFYKNGADDGTPSSTALTGDVDNTGVLYVGNRPNADRSMSGSLAELIIVEHATGTVDERTKIEGYLAHKWGLTGSLPADHDYKTDPPRRSSVYTG